jgi:uncharacterized protein (DUF2236 family)
MARAPRRLTRRPGSAAEVWGEGFLLAGGGRALLLQLADPAIARGVAEHSDFERAPLRRLVGTLEYIYVLGFGTDQEIAAVAREVGRAHRGVQGDGDVPYDARDEGLQLWVAATLYETSVRVVELAYGPLDERAAEELYRRDALIGTALGMPASAWPADRAAFAEYWDGRVASLRVTPPARRVARSLLRPTSGPLWMRALMPLVRLVTAGLLPPEVRAGYGVRWDDRLQRRFDLVVRMWAAVYRILPGAIRRAPSTILLRRFRARTAAQPG